MGVIRQYGARVNPVYVDDAVQKRMAACAATEGAAIAATDVIFEAGRGVGRESRRGG